MQYLKTILWAKMQYLSPSRSEILYPSILLCDYHFMNQKCQVGYNFEIVRFLNMKCRIWIHLVSQDAVSKTILWAKMQYISPSRKEMVYPSKLVCDYHFMNLKCWIGSNFEIDHFLNMKCRVWIHLVSQDAVPKNDPVIQDAVPKTILWAKMQYLSPSRSEMLYPNKLVCDYHFMNLKCRVGYYFEIVHFLNMKCRVWTHLVSQDAVPKNDPVIQDAVPKNHPVSQDAVPKSISEWDAVPK
jgi:hypothetical protein